MNIIKNIRNLTMALFLAGAASFTPSHPVQAAEVGTERIIIIIEECDNCVVIGTKIYCDCVEIVIII